MRLILSLLLSSLLLTGCATDSIPKDYNGPRAVIKDSANVHDASSADMFVLQKINGNEISDSITSSKMASSGLGARLIPKILDREVPATPTTFTLYAQTCYGAPIQTITEAGYKLTGDVQFTPQAGHTYSVKGTFADDYSAVWVQDDASGQVVGNKIEIHVSAKMSFMAKMSAR